MNTSPQTTETSSMSYLILKTALLSYQKSPKELDSLELKRVQRQAQSQYKIESCVLSSKEALDVNLPDSLLESTLAEVIARYDSETAFYEDLESNGVEYASFYEAVKRELYVEVVMDRISSRAVNVSDIDAKIYYHLHPDKFVRKEKRKISHILITINDDYAENTFDAARQRIELVYQQLLNKPKKFADLALKYSECPTSVQKGQLGEVTKGMLYPELDEVAFTLKKGEISGILSSEMGFHIIKCEGIVPKQSVSANEAMPKVKAHLEEKQRNNCKKHWLAQQLKNYNS